VADISTGISFTGALQILFIGLKLGKVIDWTWLIVLSPILALSAVIISILLGGLLFAIVSEYKEK